MATAVYPASIQTFPTKNPRIDNSSPVMADDVNLIYVEVTALESILGTTPNVGSWSGSFDGVTTNWSNVSSRLTNIEAGVKTAYNDRVKSTGGSFIAPSSSTVGLTVSAASGATANLLELKNSSGTVVTAVSPDGYILTIDGGSA